METKNKQITVFNVTFIDGVEGRHIATGNSWSLADVLKTIEHTAQVDVGSIDAITINNSNN